MSISLSFVAQLSEDFVSREFVADRGYEGCDHSPGGWLKYWNY